MIHNTIHKQRIQYTVSFLCILKTLLNKEFLISVFWHGTCFIISEYLCVTVLKKIVAQVF